MNSAVAARAAKGATPRGPRGDFLLGSLRRVQHEPLELLREGFREYGDVVRYRFGNTHAFLLAHPDHIRHVLHDNHRNYDKNNVDYAMLRRLLGNGLLTSDGAFWLRQRRLMAPMFHRQRVAGFCNLMVNSTLEMFDLWEELALIGEPIDIADEMARLTLKIVAKALFSADVSDDAGAIGAALTEVNRQLGEFSLLDMFWMIPTPRKRRFRAAVRALDQVVGKIIDERRRSAHRNQDLLSMLLEAVDEETDKGMTPRQVRDEVLTLLLAGHETTANALTWTWYLLAQNPAAADKLHQEVVGVLGRRTPDGLDLPKLPYTRMVVEESMRLYPPAWAISRNAIGDDEIGGYHVRRKTNLIICSFITHRHPEFWEEPERFDPERFSPARSEGRPNFAYLPFGGGPRICIGNSFAMTEAQLVVATVAQRYRLRLVPGHPVELHPLVTLRPRHGMRMTVHRADEVVDMAEVSDRAAR
ncbi:MAG: cytochrome P450 [Candidatus Binataceae bacterium]